MKHAIITILVVAAFCGATACRQQAGGGDKSKDTATEQGAMVKPVRKFIPALPPSAHHSARMQLGESQHHYR